MNRTKTTALLAAAFVAVAAVCVVPIVLGGDPLRSAAIRAEAEDAAARAQVDASLKEPLGHATAESVALFKELIAADTTEARRQEISHLLVVAATTAEGDSFYPASIRSQSSTIHDGYRALVEKSVLEQSHDATARAQTLQQFGRMLNNKPTGK